MMRVAASAVAVLMALTLGAEAAAPRRKNAGPERPPAGPPAAQQDEFRSCDVAVRDFVQGRKEATALPIKDIKVDGLRMTLNFVHPYGESGDTPPNLAFTRGESVEERRKALNETKQRITTLVEAAKSGNVWYVVSLRRDNPDPSDGRRSPAGMAPDDRPAASAVVLASIEDRCITVSEFKAVPIEKLSDDLRALLGDKPPAPPAPAAPATSDNSAAAPPS
jgi:hypothetical protein